MSKISDLPDGGSLASTDYLVAVRAGGNVKVQADGAVSGTTGTFSGDFNVDDGTFFVDASADSVGIGTTSPAVDLQVGNGSGLYQASISGGGYDLILGASGGNLFGYASQSISAVFNIASVPLGIGTNGLQPLILGTGATERMRIDAVGNVGIGITNPGEKLAVHGDSGNIVGVFETSTGNTNRLWLGATSTESYIDATAGVGATNMVFKVASTERARIDSSGNLLVGRSAQTSAASDAGHNFYDTGQWYSYAAAGQVVRFYETSTASIVGNITTTTSATAYNTSSDARLKENIADAEDASSLVDAIKVRQFDWKADGSHQRYGMVAQELMTVAPEAVSGDPESDDMMGVDYSKLVPMLVKEIQSLRARLAQLEQP